MKTKQSTRARYRLPMLVLTAAAWCGPSCAEVGSSTPSTSSETHFLQRCDSEAACGEGFSCLCGACTRTCDRMSTCEAVATGAQCVPIASRPPDPACPESAVIAFCDASCADDRDCAKLGNGYACDRGFCRALNENCPTQETAGSEVVLLGDSAIAATHQMPPFLEELARAAQALPEDESYRDYSEPLDNHLGGDDPGLAKQYAAARQGGPVKVVIMNGGGGDLITNGCPDPITADCPTIQDALAGAVALWNQMAEAGVEHLVFFFYPDQQVDARLKTMVDTLRPLLEQACASAALACHWLDLRPTFVGNYDEYVVPGELTQTEAGARATAGAIWSVMQQYCVAQ